MPTLWLGPGQYYTGDPELRIDLPHPLRDPGTGIAVSSSRRGDLQWVVMDLPLATNMRVDAVIVCYQLTHARSFISQTRLCRMTTPDVCWVEHDDGTDLRSTSLTCYTSRVDGLVPAGAIRLELRLNFEDTSDQVMLGAVGIRYRRHGGTPLLIGLAAGGLLGWLTRRR